MPIPPIRPASGGPERPRRKGEVTAERILDAAEELFAERGYEGTTLRDVAAQVGIRNPSLYNHFDGKESLYAAVLDRGIRPVVDLLSEFVDQREDRGELVARVMEVLSKRPNIPRLVMHETLSGGQRLTPMLRSWIGPVFARANEMVEAPEGGWDPELAPHLMLAMYHVVVGYFATAPLYKDLNGEDLLSAEALERQSRALVELTARLFSDRARSSD